MQASRIFLRTHIFRFLVFFGLCLCALRVDAGGTVEVIDGVTTITVVVPWLPLSSDISAPARAEMAVVRQFEKDFPIIFQQKYLARYQADPEKYGDFDWSQVRVLLRPFSGLRVDGVESDLMAIAGGNPPDVLYINFRKSDTYIRNGFLHPLDRPEDGYLSSLSPAELQERVHPKIWPVIRRKGPGGKEHVWALPYGGFIGRVLAYRKDLFDQAGIPYPDENWTWTDMLTAARTLTDPASGKVGVLLAGDAGWDFSTFLWSAGGEVMEQDPTTEEWKATFGSPAAAIALDFYLKLVAEPWKTTDGQLQRGYAVTDSAIGNTKWSRGEIAMNLVNVDNRFTSGLNPDLIGLAPVPLGPTGQRASELNSKMLGLYSQIPTPAVRDAAWEYIAYLETEASMRLRTTIMVESGLGRFINPVHLVRFGFPEVARLAPPGWDRVFELSAETGRPEPYGKNSTLAYRLLARPISESLAQVLQNNLPQEESARLTLLEQTLREAEGVANELMIGKVSPEDRRTRNLVAGVFLLGIATAFGYVFNRVFATFGSGPSPGRAERTRKNRLISMKRDGLIFLLLTPALLSIFVWKYYPLLRGSVMGFQDYRILGDSTWVGLKHFGDVLWDGLWWQSVWNSLRFSFLALVFGFIPPLILAILLQEVPRGKIMYRLIFYMPSMLAGLVTLLLWKQFYDPSPAGALNTLVSSVPTFVFFLIAGGVLWGAGKLANRFWFHRQKFACAVFWLIGLVFAASLTSIVWPLLASQGLGALFQTLPEPIQWLRDPRYAMMAVIIPGIWAGMGPGCLIYLAALKGIPDDYYEAAEIDGATFLDKIISIVIPTLRPLLVINFVGAFIGSWLGSADAILAMTAGQANTEVAPLNIFYKAFVYLEFGPATAMAWILAFLLIGFTVYQLRILAKVEFRTTDSK